MAFSTAAPATPRRRLAGELAEIANLVRFAPLVVAAEVADAELDALEDTWNRPNGTYPVIIVHGYTANRGYLQPLAARLRAGGFGQVHTYSQPTFTSTTAQLAAALVERVEQVLARSGAHKAVLVGHSLGGIVARYAVTYLGLETLTAGVVTLGSPHGGSPVSNRTSPLRPLLAAAGMAAVPEELCVGSALLRALQADARPSPVIWSAVGSTSDVLVPARRAAITAAALEARNTTFDGVGHISLVADGRVVDHLLGELHRIDDAAHSSPAAA